MLGLLSGDSAPAGARAGGYLRRGKSLVPAKKDRKGGISGPDRQVVESSRVGSWQMCMYIRSRGWETHSGRLVHRLRVCHKVYRLSPTSQSSRDTVPMNLPEKPVRDNATVLLGQKDRGVHASLTGISMERAVPCGRLTSVDLHGHSP